MDKKKSYDFLAGLVFILLSFYIIGESLRMNADSKTIFYTSPGFLPIIFSGLLLLCALMLIKKSCKEIGFTKALSKSFENVKDLLKSSLTFNILIGLVILSIYTFVLLEFLSYWLASLIFLIFIMGYMRSTSILKAVAISALSVGTLVGLFEFVLNVRLP